MNRDKRFLPAAGPMATGDVLVLGTGSAILLDHVLEPFFQGTNGGILALSGILMFGLVGFVWLKIFDWIHNRISGGR